MWTKGCISIWASYATKHYLKTSAVDFLNKPEK